MDKTENLKRVIYIIKLILATGVGVLMGFLWAKGIEVPAIVCITAWSMMGVRDN